MRVTAALIVLGCIAGPPAAAYDRRDAEYVTSSRNAAILDYIVCLQKAAAKRPSASITARLQVAQEACAEAAAKLPRSISEPNAGDILDMILECGFRPGDASPDMGC